MLRYDGLPACLVRHIFSFLSYKELLLRVEPACRAWRTIATHDGLSLPVRTTTSTMIKSGFRLPTRRVQTLVVDVTFAPSRDRTEELRAALSDAPLRRLHVRYGGGGPLVAQLLRMNAGRLECLSFCDYPYYFQQGLADIILKDLRSLRYCHLGGSIPFASGRQEFLEKVLQDRPAEFPTLLVRVHLRFGGSCNWAEHAPRQAYWPLLGPRLYSLRITAAEEATILPPLEDLLSGALHLRHLSVGPFPSRLLERLVCHGGDTSALLARRLESVHLAVGDDLTWEHLAPLHHLIALRRLRISSAGFPEPDLLCRLPSGITYLSLVECDRYDYQLDLDFWRRLLFHSTALHRLKRLHVQLYTHPKALQTMCTVRGITFDDGIADHRWNPDACDSGSAFPET